MSVNFVQFGRKWHRIGVVSLMKQLYRWKHTLRQTSTREEISDFVELTISGEKLRVHEAWLRHHCKCPECFETKTQERNVVPNASWLTSKLTGYDIVPHTNQLHFKWMDGHSTTFDYGSLHEALRIMSLNFRQKSIPMVRNPVMPNFITSIDPLNDVAVPYNEFVESDQAVRKVLSAVLTTGFAVVSEVPGLDETKRAHDRISHPIRTIYGEGVTVMIPDLEHNDAAYSTVPLALHTDTTYFTEPMGLQSFHILSRSGTGGQNCLADGFLAAKLLYEENPELYQVLCETPLEFQYLHEGHCDFRVMAPTLHRHPGTGRLEQVRYNPRHITTVSYVGTNSIPLFYEALVRFTELLNENTIWVQLEPGTIIWLDNWRVLHGRNGFVGYRSVASGYFPRSDWLSRARTLGLKC